MEGWPLKVWTRFRKCGNFRFFLFWMEGRKKKKASFIKETLVFLNSRWPDRLQWGLCKWNLKRRHPLPRPPLPRCCRNSEVSPGRRVHAGGMRGTWDRASPGPGRPGPGAGRTGAEEARLKIKAPASSLLGLPRPETCSVRARSVRGARSRTLGVSLRPHAHLARCRCVARGCARPRGPRDAPHLRALPRATAPPPRPERTWNTPALLAPGLPGRWSGGKKRGGDSERKAAP